MKIFQVDAFTEQPFKGNPAGVCILEGHRPDDWMRSVALEMNLSETAFLLPAADGYELRWFTPKREVSLCGHATLASAHVLWEEQWVDARDEIRFYTKSGLLTTRKQGALIVMDFPARFAAPAEKNGELEHALGIAAVSTSKASSPHGDTYLLEVAAEQVVRTMAPNFDLLRACGIRSVIVTSPSPVPEYDFVSRYFAPGVGIQEDPVTGSAHCYLAPYWASRKNKTALVGFQASERSGVVRCWWKDERVLLGGAAVTIFKGELHI